MTTMDLNATLLKELSTIASDEAMVKEVINYIRRLRRNHSAKKADPAPSYTMEELNARIEQAEKNYAEGRYTDNETVHREIMDLLSSL